MDRPRFLNLQAALILGGLVWFAWVLVVIANIPPKAPIVQPLTASKAAQQDCTIVRVIDGDTVVVNVRLIDDVWLYNAPMRINGIDCPEMDAQAGKDAKAFTDAWLASCAKRNVRVDVRIVTRKRDKYGRLLGDLEEFGKGTLSGELLEAGHAKVVNW